MTDVSTSIATTVSILNLQDATGVLEPSNHLMVLDLYSVTVSRKRNSRKYSNIATSTFVKDSYCPYASETSSIGVQ